MTPIAVQTIELLEEPSEGSCIVLCDIFIRWTWYGSSLPSKNEGCGQKSVLACLKYVVDTVRYLV